MALEGSHTDLVQEISLEEDKVAEKRLATNNPDWRVLNADKDADHNAGYIPEEIWKRDYSPKSKERTAV